MTDNKEIIAKELFFGKYAHGKNMIAVCSGTYGTGKTWLSLMLACALAGLKRKVLFFDGDCSASNVLTFIDISVPHNLSDAICKQKTLNQVIYHSDKYGLDLICSDSKNEGLDALPIGTLQLLMDDLSLVARFYDDIILDISSRDKKTVCRVAGMAKKIILILSPNPKTMIEGYSFIQTMTQQHPSCEINVVINQVNSTREGELIFATFVETIGRHMREKPELLGIICNDMRIRDCQRNQTIILSRYPNAEASAEILKIARKSI